MSLFGFFGKKKNDPAAEQPNLDQAVAKTRESLLGKITRAFLGRNKLDEAFLDELEEILIGSDVGIETTLEIIENIRQKSSRSGIHSEDELKELLSEVVSSIIPPKSEQPQYLNTKPYVIMVVGVNGVGKTTTIGKLAAQFRSQGLKVLLGAGDTFRAAAVEQLNTWAQRSGADILSLGNQAEPASVAHDTIKKGVEDAYDVVILDTAGRLHNKVGLMQELAKVKRVMQRFKPDAPHEVLLVLDASTGQNAFEQARAFTEATEVNALALTKLDGTARGGVVLGISHKFKVPVKYLGVGEGIDDLRPFDAHDFVEAMFGKHK
jgi:fused signal recognition particle receptor